MFHLISSFFARVFLTRNVSESIHTHLYGMYYSAEATYLSCYCAVWALGGVRGDGSAAVGQVVAEQAGQPAIRDVDCID